MIYLRSVCTQAEKAPYTTEIVVRMMKIQLNSCAASGIRYIATPQTAPLREIQPDGSRHPFDQFIVAKTPAARWGNAEDLGGPAVFLASEASDFVNGLILYVDGGILAYIGKQPG